MKRLLIFSLFLVSMISISYAQDVVYFTDGSIINGEILELDPNSTVKIRTEDGGTFVIKMSEVERIAKEGERHSDNLSAYSGNTRLVERRKTEFYWIDNGEKLTLQEYDEILTGDLFTTFKSAQKQFSNGNSLLFCSGVLFVTTILCYKSYLNSAYTLVGSSTTYYDNSKLLGYAFSAIGTDVCLGLGIVFRCIGQGRMEWVKDTYNKGGSNTAAKMSITPSLMMTAQRDMGLGATLSISF